MRLQTLLEARWIFLVVLVLDALTTWMAMRLSAGAGVGVGIFWLAAIAYVFYFFRDPDREAPADPNEIVAAADGKIAEIKEMVEPYVLKKPMKRVAIFLSVFDVHTNRAPIDGTIIHCQHAKGKFLDARHPEATHVNECQTWAFENPRATLVVRQITGAIARRIVGWSKVGDTLKKGERFGMIRFGSRTEVYVPFDSEITVKIGDRVQGGASVIARLK
jgi:phosphatidylserine decarboxylase